MKKFKRWLALILAVVLVGSNALYSMSSALKANEMDAAQETSAQAASEPAPQEPESNNEGVDVSVVDQGSTAPAQKPAQQPVQQEPAQPTGQNSEPAASVTEPQENESEQPQGETPEEAKYGVVIHKPEADGGVVKVWTAGDKKTVSYDGNNIYKEEVAEGTTYNIEITANDGYVVEKVTDKNGTVINPVGVNGNVYTYSLTEVAEDKEVSILYKEVKASNKSEDKDDTKEDDREGTAVETTEARPAKKVSETVDGTVITVEAPEGVLAEGWTLSVKPVSKKSVEAAIENALEEEREISGIKAFDITILDKDGKEIQPDGNVNVTFSNVGIDGEVLEVYHVNDSKKKAELVGQAVGSYAVGCEAEHFSIYTIVGTDWIYAREASQAYEMYVGDEITLKSTGNEQWYYDTKNNEWGVQDSVSDKIKLSKEKEYSVLLSALKASDSVIKITHKYDYKYDASQKWKTLEENFYIQIKDRQTVTAVTVTGESQVLTTADEPLQLTATTDPAGEEVTWASSNPKVASVSKDGKVTALNTGSADITASAGNVASDPYEITVTQPYTLTFNRNGGTGSAAPEAIQTTEGSYITLPDYKGTNGTKLFVGWSTDSKATGEGPDHYKSPVYEAGSNYMMPAKNVTLYAVWAAQNLDADFFIRKDGTIPTEPQGHAAAEYTKAIGIKGAIKIGAFYTNSTVPGVTDRLNKVPDDSQIKNAYPQYNPSTQYVLWYVIKHQDNWHVDGVLLDKDKVNLSYNANAPAGWSNMPDGEQYVKDSSATVSTKEPVREGYRFGSWNTNADGSGTTYAGGERFKISVDTTLYAQWEPKGDTKYTIEYYLQNDDGTYPDSASETDVREGTTGATVNSGDRGIQGYTYDAENKSNIFEGEVKADGSLVLKRYYKKQFTVTYDPGSHGDFEAQVYDKQYFGDATPKFDGEPKAEGGYTFKRWTPEVKDKISGNITYTAEWVANKAKVSVWFYKVQENSPAYVITNSNELSTDGAQNKYVKNIDSDNKEGYSTEQIKAYAEEAYGITEEVDRYQTYEIQVRHTGNGDWDMIDSLDTYVIQEGDDIRYHVIPEAANTLTYVAGEHSSGISYVDGHYYKGESAEVKTFNETGLVADTGYKFDHWENEAGETVSGTYKMGSKDATLKAVCVKDEQSTHKLKYTVEYYKDGAPVSEDTREIVRDVWINDDVIPVLDGDIDTSDGRYQGYHFAGTNPKEIGKTVEAGTTIKVYYEANNDTAYTVEQYYQKSGSYSADPDNTIITTTGTTGQLVDTLAFRNPDKEGYVYDADAPGKIETGVVLGDGSLVLKVYFKQQFSVTYKPGEHGTFDDKTYSGLDYDEDTPSFTATGEEGYEFAGWAPDVSNKVTASVEYVAQWKARNNTEYKVEYYYQSEGTYPDTTKMNRKGNGTTGDTAKLIESDMQTSRDGYVYDATNPNNVTEGTISGDGSLVLKVYFKQQFSVMYKPGSQGTFQEKTFLDLDYGVDTPAFDGETTGNPGYTFVGWGKFEEKVTQSMQYVAQWKANTDTAYTVEHYQEQLNGGYRLFEREDTLAGTTGETATANAKTYIGFYQDPEVAGTIESGTVAGDGSLVLKLFYTREEHTVTYLVDGEQYGEVENYKYGEAIDPLREAPVKEGYSFSGWDRTLPEVMGTEDLEVNGTFTINTYNVTYVLDGAQYGDVEPYEYNSDVTVRPAPGVAAGYHFSGWSQKEDFKMPASNVTIEGSTIANPDTEYKVEHYLEGLDGTYGEPEETETFTKTTDTAVTAEPNTYEGFTYDPAVEGTLTSGTVAGDGSLVLKLYYTRNSHKVTYSYTGAIPTGASELPEEAAYKFGEEVGIAEAAAASGYTFSGWSRTEAFTMPDKDVEITGTFTANGDTKYTVEHYLEGLDGKYTVGLTEDELFGETDTLATANPTTFTGFTYDKDSEKNVTEGTITGNGKLVLKLYYTRDEHTVEYLVDGERHGAIDTYKYGETIDPLRDRPTKKGHTFHGWEGTLPSTMGTEDIVITGRFSINSYKVIYELNGELYKEDSYNYGMNVKIMEAPVVKPGYSFSGWTPDSDFTMPDHDVTITGKVTANENTEYKVEHYLENLNGTYGEPETTETFTKTTDTVATAEPNTYKGFTYDPTVEGTLASGTVAGDGSLVLKLYYTRNSHKVTYSYTGAIPTGASEPPEEATYKFGAEVGIAEAAAAPGYTFSGWSRTEAFTMPDKDVEITGTFTADGDTKYTVEHYLEGLDGKYAIGLTENLTGETDTLATANPTTFTGFTYDKDSEKNVTEGTITGDGKLVLKLYYARDEHTVEYLVDGERHGAIDTYKYGETIDPLRDRPTKEGYTFHGWEGTLPSTMGTEDIVITGRFSINSYNVIYMIDGVRDSVEPHEYNSTVTLKNQPAKEGYTFSGWQHPDNFTMPAEDVVINGTFKINSYRYTVNYFYDNDQAKDETVNESASFLSTVKADTPDTKTREGRNYMLKDTGMAYETTIGTDEDMNVINVYYVLDNNGPDEAPDGIPDAEEYGIIYNANAQNATGETKDNAIYPVDYQVTLKDNGFRNDGYVFDGWSSDADSGNVYNPGGWIKMSKGGLVMNAQWSVAPVTPGGTTPDGTTPGGTTPDGDGTATPANAGPVTPAAVIQTIVEPVAAFAQDVGDAIGANIQQLVQSDDEGVPLANRASKDHKCCILHFLLLLLALLVELGYTRSMKKRQERIFELREELAMADKEIDKDEAA
ncbi:InlB B-repeat-containing protein [Dorea sp. D27]|uniref:InlB B-repeat-containing protein n=1 Tax=Dorea sp. D27 TaxID=658665 RepID=UPI0006738587|nr:InlB B-repeat-containing protein [Dorea sp. D27]KMZ54503.1 hypothetical protein HMPREF0980_01357 [Dorea sp. D27]